MSVAVIGAVSVAIYGIFFAYYPQPPVRDNFVKIRDILNHIDLYENKKVTVVGRYKDTYLIDEDGSAIGIICSSFDVFKENRLYEISGVVYAYRVFGLFGIQVSDYRPFQ